MRQAWTEEEDHAIRTFVKQYGAQNWSQISKSMQDQFGQSSRSGKQCRERWHNHLNPKIKREAWTTQEQERLFQAHQKHGNSWKMIAEALQGRTENDVKNKFYSLLRKKLRKISKLVGHKDSTSRIKHIKPRILSNLLNSEHSLPQLDRKRSRESQQIRQFLLSFDPEVNVDEVPENPLCIDLIKKVSELNHNYVENKSLEGLESLPFRVTRSRVSEVEGIVANSQDPGRNMVQENLDEQNQQKNRKIVGASTASEKQTAFTVIKKQTATKRPSTSLRRSNQPKSRAGSSNNNNFTERPKSQKVPEPTMSRSGSKLSRRESRPEQMHEIEGQMSFDDHEFASQPLFSFSPSLSKVNSSKQPKNSREELGSNNLKLLTRKYTVFYHSSPMMTRNDFISPKMPTPGVLIGQGAMDYSSHDIGNPETYINIFESIKKQVQRNTNSRD